jgi:hypothetical protein
MHPIYQHIISSYSIYSITSFWCLFYWNSIQKIYSTIYIRDSSFLSFLIVIFLFCQKELKQSAARNKLQNIIGYLRESLTLTGKVTNLFYAKMAERSEDKSAKRRFASKVKISDSLTRSFRSALLASLSSAIISGQLISQFNRRS